MRAGPRQVKHRRLPRGPRGWCTCRGFAKQGDVVFCLQVVVGGAPRAETCLQNASHDLQARLTSATDKQIAPERVRAKGSIALGRLAGMRCTACQNISKQVMWNVLRDLPGARPPLSEPDCGFDKGAKPLICILDEHDVFHTQKLGLKTQRVLEAFQSLLEQHIGGTLSGMNLARQ